MVIVDASVALKWVLEEPGTDRARTLLTQENLGAPDLFWIECANVLWVKARRGQISPVDARAAFEAIAATPITSLSTSTIAGAAQDLAFALDHAAYDCLYLAAAIAERTVLVTADEAFAKAVIAHGVHAASVRVL
jgi:predicted nucleic acid-binding protein